MALVIAPHPSVRSTDPTTSLQQALVSFEGSLTDVQKRQYQAGIVRPDASSAITFVAQVDAENSNKIRRCVAPRLHGFLEATQQFTGIVDTFVSSNPNIAGLVWGGVKMAILAANNVASYFDKVTSMIMRIGISCPTYQQFGQLYPTSVGLQRALCDYYAIIVRLCIKIIDVSSRTSYSQTMSSIFVPFESEFKEFLDNLDQATRDIHLQTSLASKQADSEARKLLELESKRNASYRQLAIKFQEGTRKEHSESRQWRIRKTKREAVNLRSSIRNNLSTIDHVKPWKQAWKQRVPTTAEWLQQEAVFQKWVKDPGTAILWCAGTMGVGKTVLVSNVIAHLHTSRQPNEIISYHFCRGEYDASLSARNILGSLTSQALNVKIEHTSDDALEDLYRDSKDLDTTEVTEFLLSHLEIDKRYYFVLDGVDECDGEEVRKVASSIAQICSLRSEGCKILCAGRPELEKPLFTMVAPKHKILITEQKVNYDIDQYIETVLLRCLEEGQLKLGDQKIILKIQEALQQGANGMFLWVRLCIEELCAQGNDNNVLKALTLLPRGLTQIFDRKLHRVKQRNAAEEAMKMLQFCGVAKRPLSVLELQEVLSITPGQKSLDRGKLPNDMDQVVNDCCGFTFVDEEDNSVHYVHHSVKKHLFEDDGLHKAQFNAIETDLKLGILCMTYLDFLDFKGQLARIRDGAGIRIQPIQLGIQPVTRSSRSSGRLAQWLLRQRKQLQHVSAQELEKKALDVVGNTASSHSGAGFQTQEFPFLSYSETSWIYHLTHLNNETDTNTWQLFCRCVGGADISACRPWEPDQQVRCDMGNGSKMTRWSIAHSHHALMLYLILHRCDDLNESTKEVVVKSAISGNISYIINAIYSLRRDFKQILDLGMFRAAETGENEDLACFLRAGADVNAPTAQNGLTALQAAAYSGRLEVVERLLTAGADVNAPAAEYGQTALQAAKDQNYHEIVNLLKRAGARK